MLNFRKITLADRPWIQEALKQSDFMGCEYSFANNLAWCRAADSQICQYENFYLTCSFDTEDGAPHFSYPCGSGDLRKAILAMAKAAGHLRADQPDAAGDTGAVPRRVHPGKQSG